MPTGHEKSAVMRYIFNQAAPIMGNYIKLDEDYVARLHRNEVPQLIPNLGTLTDKLYSSMGSTKVKSSYGTQADGSYDSSKKFTPITYSPKKDFSYLSRRKNNYLEERSYF